MSGIADVSGKDAPAQLLEAERGRRPDIAEEGPSLLSFDKFARQYVSLTSREADVVYAKVRFWNVRMGITEYADEA